MLRYKNILLTAIATLVMVPTALWAQSYGSINTFSPYSMYGLGELRTQGSLASRSMGGVGVGMRSIADINSLNPASYSMTLNRSVLFSYGMDGANIFNSQNINGEKHYNSYATMNINDISFKMPLGNKLGFALAITPYSNVGYNITTYDKDYDIGLLSYIYEGGGDVTQVNAGIGWEIFKNFSVGVAAQYYWGEISRSFSMIPYVVTGSSTYYSTKGETLHKLSTIKAQVGLQWSPISNKKHNLTIGATYDLGGDLSPQYDHKVYGNATLYTIVAREISKQLSMVLPSQIALGAAYQNSKWFVGADYVYQDWYSQNSGLENSLTTSSGVDVAYNDFGTVKIGAEYTPNRNDVRRYLRRVSYRGGVRYGGYQHSFSGAELSQLAVTAGVSLPLKMNSLSKIDVGIEYGNRSSSKGSIDVGGRTIGLINQNYFKLAVGFTLFGEDYWFQRPKFD